MAKRELYESVLRYLAEQRDTGHHPVSQADIAAALGESPSTGLPDLFRAVHRDAISELVSRVVRDGHPLKDAVAEFSLPPQDAERLTEIVKGDIARLGEHNFARYRLTLGELTRWVEAGQPLSE
jgi:hypothetical protein